MRYEEFKKTLGPFGVFSLDNIRFFYPDFDRRRLNEWKNKGYIKSARNGFYCFSNFYLLGKIANAIYYPSYLSLEYVMSYFSLIPEAVYAMTSVTTRKTLIEYYGGTLFEYRSIKNDLFFGYGFEDSDYIVNDEKVIITYWVADIEKALLDFFYFRKAYRTDKDLVELRFDEEVLASLDKEKLYRYMSFYKNKRVEDRIKRTLSVYG